MIKCLLERHTSSKSDTVVLDPSSSFLSVQRALVLIHTVILTSIFFSQRDLHYILSQLISNFIFQPFFESSLTCVIERKIRHFKNVKLG